MNRRSFFQRAAATIAGIAASQKIEVKSVPARPPKLVVFDDFEDHALLRLHAKLKAEFPDENQCYNWWEKDPQVEKIETLYGTFYHKHHPLYGTTDMKSALKNG